MRSDDRHQGTDSKVRGHAVSVSGPSLTGWSTTRGRSKTVFFIPVQGAVGVALMATQARDSDGPMPSHRGPGRPKPS